MKCPYKQPAITTQLSLPVRGAWIEIVIIKQKLSNRKESLPVRGAWIEMSAALAQIGSKSGRSPCGERGLKSQLTAP